MSTTSLTTSISQTKIFQRTYSTLKILLRKKTWLSRNFTLFNRSNRIQSVLNRIWSVYLLMARLRRAKARLRGDKVRRKERIRLLSVDPGAQKTIHGFVWIGLLHIVAKPGVEYH